MKKVDSYQIFVKDFNSFLEKLIPKSSNLISTGARYALINGGKRFRAYLLFLIGSHFKIPKKDLFYLASSIESIHAYSLVHDDMPCMDNDDLRRGKLSTHKKYGEAQGLLIGDALQTFAFEILSSKELQINNENKVACIKILAESIGMDGMIYGQSIDIASENKKPTKKVLESIHKNKTGKLIKASMMIPAVISNQSEACLNEFNALAELLGLMYQVIDDYMDATSTKKLLGKVPGKDKTSGKITYCNLFGLVKTKKIITDSYEQIYVKSRILKLPVEFSELIEKIYGRV